MAAIEVRDLAKSFDDVDALRGVDLSIDRGEFFGLLGPNGAGKSTLVRILATLTTPDRGRVRVLGRDPVAEPATVRGLVDVMTAQDRLYNRLTGWANLEFLTRLSGCGLDRDRVRTLVERLDLDPDALDRPVRTFSTGMQQKLNLVRGLILDRPVMLLDEPALGLDPVSARNYKSILREVLTDGDRTILFTSHNMYEVEELCDRVAILQDGEITAVDAPGELKETTFPTRELVLGFRGTVDLDLPVAGVHRVREDGGLHVVELDGSADLDEVIRHAQRLGELTTVHVREPTFEETFVEHTEGSTSP